MTRWIPGLLVLTCLGAALAAAAPSEDLPDPITVPFELVKNQIVLAVYLGEAGPFNMVLDTGVDPSAVDLELAREHGLLASDEPVGFAAGVGGAKVPIYAASLRGVQVGGLMAEPFDAAAMDMSGLSAKLGRPLHGILGHAFLDRRRVRIDYARSEVVFEPDAVVGAGALTFPLEFVDDDIIPLLREFQVNGVTVPVSLDTGSSLTLELYPEGAALAGVEASSAASDTVTGAAGSEAVLKGHASSVGLGEFKLRDAEVVLSQRARPGNRLGNVGNGFLKAFVLTLDYRGKTVTLEKR